MSKFSSTFFLNPSKKPGNLKNVIIIPKKINTNCRNYLGDSRKNHKSTKTSNENRT